MNVPLKISFKDFTPSDAIAAFIKERVDKLEHRHHEISSCRVTVQEPHRSHHQGRRYLISIDVTVPGREIAVGRGRNHEHSDENIYVAIRAAFQAIERQLQAYQEQRRREVKHHDPVKGLARVSRLFPNEECGFLLTPDGREIYFHSHSVLRGEFEKLRLGAEVRFDEEPGEKGPQASTVEYLRALA